MKKNIIVTGGTRGIGRAIATKLLQDGYTVHVLARSQEELEKLAVEMPGVHTHQLDIANRDAIKAFAAQWNEPLYGLVNNAGVFTVNGKDAERLDDPEVKLWDPIMNINLQGLFSLLTPFFRTLQTAGVL